MSKSKKTQTMHDFHHGKGPGFHTIGAGYRYGNNRKHHANIKVKLRRAAKRNERHEALQQ